MQMDENNYLIKPQNTHNILSCFVLRLQNNTSMIWSERWLNQRVLTTKTNQAYPPFPLFLSPFLLHFDFGANFLCPPPHPAVWVPSLTTESCITESHWHLVHHVFSQCCLVMSVLVCECQLGYRVVVYGCCGQHKLLLESVFCKCDWSWQNHQQIYSGGFELFADS